MCVQGHFSTDFQLATYITFYFLINFYGPGEVCALAQTISHYHKYWINLVLTHKLFQGTVVPTIGPCA